MAAQKIYRGIHSLKSDSKGRLNLPASLGCKDLDGLVLISHPEQPAIIAREQFISDEATDTLTAMFSQFSKIDPDGRILLNAEQRDKIQLKRGEAVTIVGMKNHFQIWSTANWKIVEPLYADELVRRLTSNLDVFVPGKNRSPS
ncbi:MAG: hypothetical protein R3D88_06365 [Alphaproteobacteria bacterium]|jgi:DNA-binding transcriptional regulator/RsmH inhibitor MraZ|nr:hypothetical protein [Alphaproteobacteria bacterium]